MDGQNNLMQDESGNFVERFQEPFNFDTMDSIEDEIREAMAKGQSLSELIKRIVEVEAAERANEAVAAVIAHIADSAKPRLAADHLAWISGMRTTQGQALPALAKRNGVTKQAFSQAAVKLADALGIRPARQMRSSKAREAMAKAYAKRKANQNQLQTKQANGNGTGTKPQRKR
jgi:hypothetical protein